VLQNSAWSAIGYHANHSTITASHLRPVTKKLTTYTQRYS
jgi:hypothetical protein